MASPRCHFLDILPPEIRLMIYENLLVSASSTIPASASKDTSTPTTANLSTSILRVNRQIHNEAAAVLYSRNTIYIRPRHDHEAESEAAAAAQKPGSLLYPAIAPSYLPMVRHVRAEALHCAERTPAHVEGSIGKVEARDGEAMEMLVVQRRAMEYVTALTTTLTQTPSLRTLHLSISPRKPLPTKTILTALLPLKSGLAALHTALARTSSPSSSSSCYSATPAAPQMHLAFEFSSCFYRARVTPGFLAQENLLVLACRVLFWKGHLSIESMVREFEEDATEETGKAGERGARVDLGPLVERDVGEMARRVGEVDGLVAGLG